MIAWVMVVLGLAALAVVVSGAIALLAMALLGLALSAIEAVARQLRT